jgi:Protein of unknown function (DUF2842)
MRHRSLIGTMAILGGLAAYAGAVSLAAERMGTMNGLIQAGFYALAGTVWVVPAAYLTRWMQGSAVSAASSARAGNSAPRSDRCP